MAAAAGDRRVHAARSGAHAGAGPRSRGRGRRAPRAAPTPVNFARAAILETPSAELREPDPPGLQPRAPTTRQCPVQSRPRGAWTRGALPCAVATPGRSASGPPLRRGSVPPFRGDAQRAGSRSLGPRVRAAVKSGCSGGPGDAAGSGGTLGRRRIRPEQDRGRPAGGEGNMGC